MNILIASVDNVRANEIRLLAQALNKKHRVTIACMAHDAHCRGQAFSFRDEPVRVSPLLYKEVMKSSNWVSQLDADTVKNESKTKTAVFDNIAAFEFFTNPADAMSVMLCEIIAHQKPDLVICGINNGTHMGQNIYTSSNIGMAMESAFFGFPTIAVAVDLQYGGHREERLENAVKFIEKNVEKFAALKLPPHTFLNISVPYAVNYKDLKGVKFARMSRLLQQSEFVEKIDSNGVPYYWAKHAESAASPDDTHDDSAQAWFDRGYISIIPLSYDATDYEAVKKWSAGVITQIRKEEEQEAANEVKA